MGWVPEAGHALFIDEPGKFDDELARLLKTVGQPAPWEPPLVRLTW
jgi:hypothetical protein